MRTSLSEHACVGMLFASMQKKSSSFLFPDTLVHSGRRDLGLLCVFFLIFVFEFFFNLKNGINFLLPIFADLIYSSY